MKLSYNKNSKDPIYYVQQGFRNGKKTTTKNIARIGKHSELLKITDDPLAYAIDYVKKLNNQIEHEKVTMQVNINFAEKLMNTDNSVYSKSTLKNIGYLYLGQVLSQLRIGNFLKDVMIDSKATFDPCKALLFLTATRTLAPGSKLSASKLIENYYGFSEEGIQYQHLLRTMDILEDNYDSYLNHLFEASNNIVKRNTSVCYYDCTNFYFEKETEDEDYFDEVTGELIRGLLKYGISKEHRPNPIVQMGLFMDGDGIPISMTINPGNQAEIKSAVPCEKKMLEMFKEKNIIYCADAGLGYTDIRVYNTFSNRKYIVTQSIPKLPEPLQIAVTNDYDYRLLSTEESISLEKMMNFDRSLKENLSLYNDRAYKVIPYDQDVDVGLEVLNELGKSKKDLAKLKQSVIITYSRKAAEYQKYIRNRQIERAKKLLISGTDLSSLKKSPNDAKRFLKKENKGKDIWVLDEEAIKKEAQFDGFYAIATNIDTNKTSVKEILAISEMRYQIEDCFRVMKTNFEGRPVYHYKAERIKAHFLICFTALLAYRLLEVQLKNKGKQFSVNQIIETLRNMEVANCQNAYYMSTYTGSDVLNSLNELYPIGLDKKYYQPKTLNSEYKKIFK